MSGKPQSKTEVLQGTLDLLVLETLDSLGPLHGYAIAARFEQVSGGALQLNMGTLYPARCGWSSEVSSAELGALRRPIAEADSTQSRRRAGPSATLAR